MENKSHAMAAGLFVVAGHGRETGLAGEAVVQIHGSAAWQQEDVIHAEVGQAAHDPVGDAEGRHGAYIQ